MKLRALPLFMTLACALAHAQTANMGMSLPVVGTTVGPTWATMLNTALGVVDTHDHSTGKGVKVTQNGINLTGILEFNDNHLSELKSSRFQEQASPLGTGSDIRSLYVSGGNLYYNNASGNQIQLTSGSQINVVGLGGFGGDYISAGASVIYTDSTKLYTFRQPNLTNAHITVNNATITGNASITGTLGSGAATLASATITGAGSVGTTFTATGGLSTLQSVQVNTTLGVTGTSTTAAIVHSGDITPNATLTRSLGSTSLRYAQIWSNYVTATASFDTPTNDAEQATLHTNNMVAASGSFVGSGGGITINTPNWNIASAVRNAIGSYTVTLDRAVNANSAAVCSALGTAPATKTCNINLFSTTQFNVLIANDGGAAADDTFSVIIVGQPATLP